MPRTRKTTSARSSQRSTSGGYHLVVASSGDHTSDGAIRVAEAIARAKRASIEVITVATPFPHAAPTALQVAPPPVLDANARAEAIARVREQLSRIGVGNDWPIQATVGWPSERIAEGAASRRASLLVVGLGEHGILHRLFGSETAVKLAHRSFVPVLAVPDDAQNAPTHALAAVDFTPASLAAARTAGELIGSNGTLTLAYASMFVCATPEAGSFADLCTTGAEERLAEIRERLEREVGCRIDMVALPGEIVPSLLAYAESAQCDLIAIGGDEQTLIDRLLLGSIRSGVIRRSRTPVLVVRHTSEAESS